MFRHIVGFTQNELAASTGMLPDELDLPKVSKTRIKAIEEGRAQNRRHSLALAETA